MSDRVCIRGCAKKDVHYATCEFSGPGYVGQFPCRGCAPRECREGSLICDRCFGHLRGLLSDAPDLLARLRSIGDPTKATAYDDVKMGSSSATVAPAPIADDLLDAIHAVEEAVSWRREDLAAASNDLQRITYLSGLVLDRHHPVNGIRAAWSVQDAVDRWGVERRDRPSAPANESRALRPTPEYEDDSAEPRREWGDPLVGKDIAERIAGSARTLRRWLRDGDVAPVGEIHIAGIRTRIFRRSDLVAVRESKEGRQRGGRFEPPNHEIGSQS